jgi:hypothetical protein
MPIPVWDAGEDRPWNVPPEPPAPARPDQTPPQGTPRPQSPPPGPPGPPESAGPASGPPPPGMTSSDTSPPGAIPPGPESSTPNLGVWGAPMPSPGQENATQRLGEPWGGPVPPGQEPPPGQENATQRLGEPWGGPVPPGQEPPPGQENATQRLGEPWGGPVPPGQEPPPGQENATKRLGEPWGSPVPPGQEPPPGWTPGGPPPIGPGGPAGSEKSRKTPLLIGGIVAVVVLGVGAVWALTQGVSGSKGGTDNQPKSAVAGSAAQQASAVNEILKTGSTARAHLPGRLKTCDDVSAGVSGFQQVVQDREQELSRSKALKVDQLPNGARLRRSMITAYQSSLDADRAYLSWAREIQSRGCGHHIAPLTESYKNAIAANGKAGPAKRQVAGLWKPIAAGNGLPAYAWNHL